MTWPIVMLAAVVGAESMAVEECMARRMLIAQSEALDGACVTEDERRLVADDARVLTMQC